MQASLLTANWSGKDIGKTMGIDRNVTSQNSKSRYIQQSENRILSLVFLPENVFISLFKLIQKG